MNRLRWKLKFTWRRFVLSLEPEFGAQLRRDQRRATINAAIWGPGGIKGYRAARKMAKRFFHDLAEWN